MVTLLLKLSSSGLTVKSGIDHRTCKKQITHQIPFDNPDRPHSCKKQSFVEFSTLFTSQNVINTGFKDTNLTGISPVWPLWDCVKACNTINSLPFLVDVRGLPDGHLFKFRTVKPVSNLSRYPTVVTCVCVCARNSFVQLHCTSDTFFFVSLNLHLHWCSSETSSYDVILFYATCYHLAVYTSTKNDVHLSFRIILLHRCKYDPSHAIKV
jgi:hypothetical protein